MRATRLRIRSDPPGFHLEHPTAEEGCRSASQGYTLTLVADIDSTTARRVKSTRRLEVSMALDLSSSS